MAEKELEIEGTELVEVKTLSCTTVEYPQINSLLNEGWVVLDTKVVEYTQEKELKDGSPYVSRYAKVVWVLGKFAEE